MNSQQPVASFSGDYEEIILRLAKHLGRDKNRRAVFNLIYGRGSRPRSKKQIAQALGKVENAQIIQNALDELSKHHLIVRTENKGVVKDGSRWLYSKDNSVRANRDKIVKFADDPGSAKKVATKRHPSSDLLSFVKPTVQRAVERRLAGHSRKRNHIKARIALLVSNPSRRASLQTMVEARDIEQAIKREGKSDEISLKMFLAPTFDSLLDALNTYKPDVLHFSGHGGGQTLLFDNERAGDDGGTVLNFDMVAQLIEATQCTPKLLVLAACDTADGADRFLNVVPAVVAMSDSIEDEAACEFSVRFYQSLSAGAHLRDALRQAKLKLEHKGYKDAHLPSLITAKPNAEDWTLI